MAKHLPRSDQSSTVDRSGTFAGTPAYMSPEVLLERAPDGRADIFSLGVVFYEVLTGQHPFLAGSFVATTDRIRSETPASIRIFNRSVPPGSGGVGQQGDGQGCGATVLQRSRNAGRTSSSARRTDDLWTGRGCAHRRENGSEAADLALGCRAGRIGAAIGGCLLAFRVKPRRRRSDRIFNASTTCRLTLLPDGRRCQQQGIL